MQTSTRWTHTASIPLNTDIRDGYVPGTNAGMDGTLTNPDSVYIPAKSGGTKFTVIFVQRVGYNTPSDYLLVYLQRVSAPWPTQNL